MQFNFNWNAVSGGAPYVTIAATTISLNSVSAERIGNPKQVLLGFDEDQLVIGIKPYEDELNTKPFTLMARMKGGWVRLGCKEFIRHLCNISGLDFGVAKKYTASYDGVSNILYVELRQQLRDTFTTSNITQQ